MTDDIVTRLRERAIVLFSNGADGNAFIDEEAADEIERLRAELGTPQILIAPSCSCGDSMIPSTLNVTNFGDAQQKWLVSWRCTNPNPHS